MLEDCCIGRKGVEDEHFDFEAEGEVRGVQVVWVVVVDDGGFGEVQGEREGRAHGGFGFGFGGGLLMLGILLEVCS